MKKIILIFLIAACKLSQAQITFQKSYSGTYGYCVRQTNDDGFILMGNISIPGAGNEANLIKTDAYGDTIWTRTYGTSISDVAQSGLQTSDGGYIILVHSEFPNNTILIRTNSLGDTLWAKQYDLPAGESLLQTSDGGFIWTGVSISNVQQNGDIYLLKTDSLGEVLWEKAYGYEAHTEVGICLARTSDNGFIIGGKTEGSPTALSNVVLIRTDSFGDTLWTKEMGGAGVDRPESILQTLNGDFLVTGYSTNGGSNPNSIFLNLLDSVGNMLWSKSFSNGMPDKITVLQTPDSGFAIAGPSIDGDVFLIKTNSTGDSLWTRSFGGPMYDGASFIQQTWDGGFIISGKTQSFATSPNTMYLIKTDAEGNSGCNENSFLTIPGSFSLQNLKDTLIVSQLNDSATSITLNVGYGGTASGLCLSLNNNEIRNTDSGLNIYPNPTTGILNISLNDHQSDMKINRIEIFNMIGEVVFEKSFSLSSQSMSDMNLDISFLKGGIYVAQLSGDKIYRARIIKQ